MNALPRDKNISSASDAILILATEKPVTLETMTMKTDTLSRIGEFWQRITHWQTTTIGCVEIIRGYYGTIKPLHGKHGSFGLKEIISPLRANARTNRKNLLEIYNIDLLARGGELGTSEQHEKL